MQDAQTVLTEEANGFVITNNNETTMVGGRHFEKFGNADYDGSTLYESLLVLQRNSARNQISLVHAGEPCTHPDPENPSEFDRFFHLGLAMFLVAAEEHAYFSCTSGWTPPRVCLYRSDRPPRMPCCTTCESGSCPAAAAPVVTADPPTIDLLGP